GYHQLFDVCINYYNTALQTDWDGCAVENVEFYSGHQIYSMQLVIKEWSDSGRISISFDYKTSDYAKEQIEDLFARLTALTRKIVARPDEPIKQLTLFSEEEQQKLVVEYNRTDAFYPRDQTIYQLFEAQAAKTPDKLA
ncbi:non-ribosomal peptide synthetase, partial [Mesorhizobium sp. M00.F.Ca.ET.186.01.1.1]